MVRAKIYQLFREVMLTTVGKEPPELTDDTVLLETGMDSLGFAVLVLRLEQELGYDPFVASERPLYPTTLNEFVSIYEQHAQKP